MLFVNQIRGLNFVIFNPSLDFFAKDLYHQQNYNCFFED